MRLIALLLCCSAAASAQPNQYSEFQRSIADSRSNAAYLENIESAARSPNVPYSGTSIDKSAFYNSTVRKWNRPPLSEKEAVAVEAMLKKDKAELDAWVAQNNRREAIKAPFKSRAMAAGFKSWEAEHLAEAIVDNKGVVRDDYAKYIRIPDFKDYFDAAKSTASFEELMVAIDEYEYYAPLSAFESLQSLKERFPEKKQQLDVSSLWRLFSYFNSYAVYTELLAGQISERTNHIVDEFLKLEPAYPDIYPAYRNEWRFVKAANLAFLDPYQVKATYLQAAGKKGRKELKGLLERKALAEARYEARKADLEAMNKAKR